MSNATALMLRYRDLLAALGLALVVALLWAHAVDGFWNGLDDTAILAHMLEHSLFDIFFVPVVWQELSAVNLTPWVSLSFYLDYALGGLNHRVFHLHHLVALWLVAVLVMRLCALFTGRWLACACALLFLLGTPVLRVGDQLFVRHYLEGLLLCLLALYLFLLYRRNDSGKYQMVSALCYALAMTAKEIYVPLGVLLVFMTHGTWQQRLRQVWPHLVLLALYFLWRGYMLSGHVGGYAPASSYLNLAFWGSLVSSFLHIPVLLFGKFTPFIALPMFGVIVAGLWLRPRGLPWAVLITGLVFAPLVPLVAYPGITAADRYLFLPWLLFCFAFVTQAQSLLDFAAQRRVSLWPQTAAVAVSLVCTLVLLVQREQTRQSEAPYLAALDVQMRHVWNNDEGTAFVPDPSILPTFYMVWAMGQIKQLLDPAASMPKPVVDTIFLDPAFPLHAYAADCRCMRDVSATIPERLAQFDASRREAPLSLSVSNQDRVIAWTFGPYTNGTYNVVSSFIGNMQLPPSHSGLRTQIRRGFDFYLRYTAPEGWVTYSPLLHLQGNGEVLTWERN